MTLARNVAILNLLVASRPDIANLPLDICVSQSGDVELNAHRETPDIPGLAARLAKALRVEPASHSGTATGGKPFICHQVTAKYRGLQIAFWGYEYPEGAAEAGEGP
ncbi:hypothetical protein [Streptomyces sp. NBC_01477]|uniref:hypothetical protein n=1 Tax=Streptomyces sp. NBC_01477 TaxID=2976015 RepID=UPI002E371613|nr:hypothetical protein [Streptomyces sp. NBC_01477]